MNRSTININGEVIDTSASRDLYVEDEFEDGAFIDLACAPDDGITLAEFHERHETRIVEMQKKYGAMEEQQKQLENGSRQRRWNRMRSQWD